MALVVLVVEGYFVYQWYDRYYGREAAASGAASPEETTRRYSAGPGDITSPKMAEATGVDTTQDTENNNSGEAAAETTFSHIATDENSRGDYTYVGDPAIDGDPNAVVLVAVSADRGSNEEATYAHNIGVWYDFVDRKRWAIFNQDRAAVPTGSTFRVVLPPASESFVHRAELVNIVGNSTYLDDPLTNDRPGTVLSVTQNWNPGGGVGVYNDRPVGVLYDEDVEKWVIYNRDGAPMPEGAAFNVAVSGSDENAR